MEVSKFTNLSRSAFAAGVLCFVLAACGPNPNPNGVTDFGTISGTVLDASTGQPIPNVQVSVGTIVHNVTPGDKGGFVLANVPVGNQELHVRAIGYRFEPQTILVTKNNTSLAGDKGYIRGISNLGMPIPSPKPSVR